MLLCHLVHNQRTLSWQRSYREFRLGCISMPSHVYISDIPKSVSVLFITLRVKSVTLCKGSAWSLLVITWTLFTRLCIAKQQNYSTSNLLPRLSILPHSLIKPVTAVKAVFYRVFTIIVALWTEDIVIALCTLPEGASWLSVTPGASHIVVPQACVWE